MRISKYILLFLLSCPLIIYAQDSLSQDDEPKKLILNGYLKDMLTINPAGKDSMLIDNLIHNRLNTTWYATKNLTLHLDVRNRIFHGDLVRLFNENAGGFIPDYADLIDTNNDYFDLSVVWLNQPGIVGHSMIDRAYVEWIKGKWEVRLGRQRINWGTNIVWNPNDIFNAYNFFDFDYEERQGSDAVRITRYFGFASSIELAARMSDSWDESIIAGLYKWNKGLYDFQVLAGLMRGDITVGTGWAGNIGNAGFKGEISYFHPREQYSLNDPSLSSAITLDYSLSDGTYLMASYLYNSNGELNLPAQAGFLQTGAVLSAKNLMPFMHSGFAQVSYPLHPLVNTGLGIMAFPGDNAFFLNPSATLSIRENLDLGLFAQLFMNDNLQGDYAMVSRNIFARLKWSF